ncbi:MAG TPA: DinB family protein [Candidatus Acidoferrum sp.]|nr:DinB family protein [Candidatus Acidoferrum sp.]
MPINQAFLGEFDHEMASTRISLERIPEDKFDWAPHPKSMKLGRLATHLAEMPGWTRDTIEKDKVDIANYGGPPDLKSKKDVLALFDKNVADARAALVAATDDANWMKTWEMVRGDKVVFSMPKVVVMRSFIFNHNVHHRAQLGVYLRLNNIPVPSIYGPSADEGTM